MNRDLHFDDNRGAAKAAPLQRANGLRFRDHALAWSPWGGRWEAGRVLAAVGSPLPPGDNPRVTISRWLWGHSPNQKSFLSLLVR